MTLIHCQRCEVHCGDARCRLYTAPLTGLRRTTAPLPAQLDLDGGLHEIGPQTRQERLFTPAPTQLAGQTHLDTDSEREETSECTSEAMGTEEQAR
jgi:hypothetical protein